MSLIDRMRKENAENDRKRIEEAPQELRPLIEKSMAFRTKIPEFHKSEHRYEEHIERLQLQIEHEHDPVRKAKLIDALEINKAILNELYSNHQIHLAEWNRLDAEIARRRREIESEQFPENVRSTVIDLLTRREEAIRQAITQLGHGGGEFGALAGREIRARFDLTAAQEAGNDEEVKRLTALQEQLENQMTERWEKRNRALEEARNKAAAPFDEQLAKLK